MVPVPVGAAFESLPDAYETIVFGTKTYYVSDSVFLLPTSEDGKVVYVVKPAPVGAVVSNLPTECETIIVGTTTYYRAGRLYYLPESKDGRVVYHVVEKPE